MRLETSSRTRESISPGGPTRWGVAFQLGWFVLFTIVRERGGCRGSGRFSRAVTLSAAKDLALPLTVNWAKNLAVGIFMTIEIRPLRSSE